MAPHDHSVTFFFQLCSFFSKDVPVMGSTGFIVGTLVVTHKKFPRKWPSRKKVRAILVQLLPQIRHFRKISKNALDFPCISLVFQTRILMIALGFSEIFLKCPIWGGELHWNSYNFFSGRSFSWKFLVSNHQCHHNKRCRAHYRHIDG